MGKRAVNVNVVDRYNNNDAYRLIRKFMKKVKNERILEDYRARMYYEKPSVKRRREKRRKIRNAAKRQQQQQQ